jgi:transposase
MNAKKRNWFSRTPRPQEFERFYRLLMDDAPDGYQPHLFRCGKQSKAPATSGSWKSEQARLSFDEAVNALENGYNVGIAGMADDSLVNVDIDGARAPHIDAVRPTLKAKSRSREPGTGHAFFWDSQGDIPNIPTAESGEVRCDGQYVIAPGSYVPPNPVADVPDDSSLREAFPDGEYEADVPETEVADAGYYTVHETEAVGHICLRDVPRVFIEEYAWSEYYERKRAAESEASPDPDDFADSESDSAVFDLRAEDVVRTEGGSTNPTDRWSAIFHGSSTDANMSISDRGILHCWRHGTAHGPLQILATLSDQTPSGDRACLHAGSGHQNSSAGPNRLDSGELVWAAWLYAKRKGYIPSDDPIPHTALEHIATDSGICDHSDLDDGWRLPTDAYNATLDRIETEFGVSPGRNPLSSDPDANSDSPLAHESHNQQHSPVECDPRPIESAECDIDSLRETMREDRFEDSLDRFAVWADPPGAGKTTNAALGALSHNADAAFLFDKHEKAREFAQDDALPSDFDPMHLKGAEQKVDDECMDADHANEPCPAHDSDGNCPWMRQFDTAESADYLIGVHEYQLLSTATDNRQVFVDESPSSLKSEYELDSQTLLEYRSALDSVASFLQPTDKRHHTAQRLADFCADLLDALSTADSPELADVSEPTPCWSAWGEKDPVAGHISKTSDPDDNWQTLEALAQFKTFYVSTMLRRMDRGEWDGEPLNLNHLFAAAAETSDSPVPWLQSIEFQHRLSSCPRCHSDFDDQNGSRVCSNDGCRWDETEDFHTTGAEPTARTTAHLNAVGHGDNASVTVSRYPRPAQLPDDPTILDATATTDKLSALYGIPESSVSVFGDDTYDSNMHVTQVLDGQYHASTIRNGMVDADGSTLPSSEWTGGASKIQQTIDRAGNLYDSPLFTVKKSLKHLFDWPDNAVVLHYHALRGLNRAECDAVICIGAPHPDVDDLSREAELIASTSSIRVGGVEHSTRQDAPNPPVYRTLNYDSSPGISIPTKHYTGLVGSLFRESREKELEQAVHRARPLIADDTVDVFLLSNVPTTLPVDTCCSFDELTNPLDVMLPVPDGALGLLHEVGEVLNGNLPDGFDSADQLIEVRDDGTVANNVSGFHRLAQLSGFDVTERTVRNWVGALEDVGLLQPEKYEQRSGRPYTVDSATLKSALSVLSNNPGFNVAAVRRLAGLLSAAQDFSAWVERARSVFGLSGDRCLYPPPG